MANEPMSFGRMVWVPIIENGRVVDQERVQIIGDSHGTISVRIKGRITKVDKSAATWQRNPRLPYRPRH